MSALTATDERTRRLSLREKARLALEISAAYARARRELRRGDLRSVVASLRRCATGDVVDLPPHRLGRAVGKTLRVLPVDSRCLMSSLVLLRLLARRNRPATFVLGVSPGPGFAAHAWIECAGAPVLPPGDPSFGRLLEL